MHSSSSYNMAQHNIALHMLHYNIAHSDYRYILVFLDSLHRREIHAYVNEEISHFDCVNEVGNRHIVIHTVEFVHRRFIVPILEVLDPIIDVNY